MVVAKCLRVQLQARLKAKSPPAPRGPLCLVVLLRSQQRESMMHHMLAIASTLPIHIAMSLVLRAMNCPVMRNAGHVHKVIRFLGYILLVCQRCASIEYQLVLELFTTALVWEQETCARHIASLTMSQSAQVSLTYCVTAGVFLVAPHLSVREALVQLLFSRMRIRTIALERQLGRNVLWHVHRAG